MNEALEEPWDEVDLEDLKELYKHAERVPVHMPVLLSHLQQRIRDLCNTELFVDKAEVPAELQDKSAHPCLCLRSFVSFRSFSSGRAGLCGCRTPAQHLYFPFCILGGAGTQVYHTVQARGTALGGQ